MTLSADAHNVIDVPVHHIDTGAQAIRSAAYDETIQSLALDIATHGMLQPIGVSAHTNGAYTLIWGSRRLAAVKQLRRTHIMARVMVLGEQHVRDVAMRENLHRRQMDLPEEIAIVQWMHAELKRSPAEIADAMSVGREWVLRRLAYPSLPADLRDEVETNDLSLTAAETISKIPDENIRAQIIWQARHARWTARQLSHAVDSILELPDVSTAVETAVETARHHTATAAPHYRCHRCGTLSTIESLQYVPICRDPCDDHSRTPGPTNPG